MKKPMPAAVAVLQAIGNVVDNVLADVGERQDQKKGCRKERPRPAPPAGARLRPMTME